jgi:hypothetical protein
MQKEILCKQERKRLPIMKTSTRCLPRSIAFVMLACLALSTMGVAGPPLICFPFEIAGANSLPWVGNSWNLSGNASYDTSALARDTLAILDANPPVIVRMETLRRATLYARKDPRAAKELLTRLHARASRARAGGGPDALALFDLGYLAAAYNQWMGKDENPAAGLDGYPLVSQALALRPADAEMEFAAALITLNTSTKDHGEHVQKAVAGAKTDPLLARNLASHFLGDEKQAVLESSPKNIPTMNSAK